MTKKEKLESERQDYNLTRRSLERKHLALVYQQAASIAKVGMIQS